ncbi:MAG: response regulator [Flavobacteriaceae bacterium]
MQPIELLWIDDEVDLLRPHILFLSQKGYVVNEAHSGQDALELMKTNTFDAVLLDENMPGMTGLEVLDAIKQQAPSLPVIMITKSEEENIMEEAIGAKIADYLIKPVNPNQILLALKKNLESSKLVTEKTINSYQQSFQQLNGLLSQAQTLKDWAALYQKIIYWELELDNIDSKELQEIFHYQKTEANLIFSRFIEKNYPSLLHEDGADVFSHQAFKRLVVPQINQGAPTLLLMIDNLRYDQFKSILPKISTHYSLEHEQTYYSILPTATQYARNAFFSGLLPVDMEKQHPQWWKNDTDEGGKNLFENEFLMAQLKRLGLDIACDYTKINRPNEASKYLDALKADAASGLRVVVYNFVDMISHAKTEMEVIKELASTDKAYRSLTKSWFENTMLLDIIKTAQQKGYRLIVTTDHGTINVEQPAKIIGDRETSTNIRYKTGRRLKTEDKHVFMVENPKSIGLPTINMSSSFAFAKNNYYLIYPSRYHHFVNYFRNTYQHGGISLEEICIPFAVFSPK